MKTMTTTLAHTINAFAGWHAITPEPQEIEAARRAVEASLAEFPYYRERFGDRAGLFGASDGAWLVTLCQGEPEYVRRQVLWLGTVLSSRGIPRLLLERHIELLHHALLQAASDTDRCRPLLDAAALLRSLRHEQLSERDFQALAAGFDARAEAEWARRLPRMGAILAAAVCDEAGGIGQAVARMAEWAADPARFPPGWVDAVSTTIAEARARVRTAAQPPRFG